VNWITKLAYQRERAKDNRRLFEQESAELWELLKSRMGTSAQSYERLYPHGDPGANLQAEWDLTDPAAPFFRCLTRDAHQAYTVEKCRMTLTRAGSMIKASYTGATPEVLLTLGHSERGDAVLQHDATDVSLDRASELILRPILFDDLPAD
jgi:hypothetical protein